MGNYDTNIIGYRNERYQQVWCLDCGPCFNEAQFPIHRNERDQFPLGANCYHCGREVYQPSEALQRKQEALDETVEFIQEAEELVDGFFPTPPEAEESEYTWDLDDEQGSVPVQFVEHLDLFDARRRGDTG